MMRAGTWSRRWLVVAVLAATGASIRAEDPGGAGLVAAVKAHDLTAVSALLRQRSIVNYKEADGMTALHWAVWQDDSDLAATLIAAGADVLAANRYGVTPLYLACLNGNAVIVEQLLKAGADAKAALREGETPLMTAAHAGSIEVARVLIEHGAEVDARESWRGQTALMWAAAQNHPAMVKELIARGADVNARSSVQEWERQTTSEPREKWLPPGGLSPLLFAARQGALDSAIVLADAGADLDAATPDGITSLLSAVINGHYDVAAMLLDRGADPNLADKAGRAPLFAAVDMNTMPASNRPSPKVLENSVTGLALIERLVAHGADVNARLKTQQPYRTKLDRGDDTMLTTGTTPLLRAAKAADVGAMRVLLAGGAHVTIATRAGITPLMAAAGVGTKEEDTVGRTKTEREAIEAIRLCLEAGADINAADTRGQTALHGAALQGFDEIIRFLGANGAMLDIKDKAGNTPVDMAEGRSGGVGFDGRASNPHPRTAALLHELAATRAINIP